MKRPDPGVPALGRKADDVGSATGPRPPRLPGVRDPEGASFEVVEVEARGHHVPARVVKAGIAMSSLAIVALVAVGLMTPRDDLPRSPLLAIPSAGSEAVAVAPTPAWTQLTSTAIPPGPFEIVGPTRNGEPWVVSVVVPEGWSEKWYESTIYKGDYELDTGPMIVAHDVARVVTQVCGFAPANAVSFAEIDPTSDDFIAALAGIPGLEVSEPTDDVVGGYPAKRFNLAFSQRFLDRCGGPEGRTLWEDARGDRFVLLSGGAAATVLAVDVDGLLMVVAGQQRGSPPEEAAELDAVLASVQVRPALPWWDDEGPMFGWLASNEIRVLDVAGVRFSIRVPSSVEGEWYREGQTSLNATIDGEDATAIIYWAGYPFDPYASHCFRTRPLPEDASIGELADAVAGARGTDLITGPRDVTVGGRPAKYTEVTVREDVGCDPGFFFTWVPFQFGPLWTASAVGDTLSSWVVDLDGQVLFVAAETHAKATGGVALSDAHRAKLDQEIHELIDSVQFE
jgi:hypothetical protein